MEPASGLPMRDGVAFAAFQPAALGESDQARVDVVGGDRREIFFA